MDDQQQPYPFQQEDDAEWPGESRPRTLPKKEVLRKRQRQLWEREKKLTEHYEAGKVYEVSDQLAFVRTELREVEAKLRLHAQRGFGNATGWRHLRRAALIFACFPDLESQGDFYDAACEVEWPDELDGADGEAIWRGVHRLCEDATGTDGVPPRYAYFDGFKRLVQDLNTGRLTPK